MTRPIATIDKTPCGGSGIRVDGRAVVPCSSSTAEKIRQRVQEELDAAYEAGRASMLQGSDRKAEAST